MSHSNSVFSQLLKLISRHEFETLAKTHHKGRVLRTMSRWSQFVALSFAQLAGRCSLRDIVSNLDKQRRKSYHLGIGKVSRSSLARVNEQQPYQLYEGLFWKLLARCQSLAPRHGFRFKNKLYSLDASTIDLCLSLFPWAKFRKTKGAIKLHVGLDHDGFLPVFMTITEGKQQDITQGRSLELDAGSIVVFDRGYTDYTWFNLLNSKGIYFVTRLKANTKYRVISRHPVNKEQGITSDQTLILTGPKADTCPIKLRRMGYRDPQTGKHYVFLTNQFELTAKTIADIYKSRWQIELFFKCIKQNLKIKSFVGTSKNAVMTQIWVAMCMCLMVAYLKFCSKLDLSIQQIIRLFQVNLFERRDLWGLLKGDPPGPIETQVQIQFTFS
ncbi:MAG: IS4 family transposase [Gammaproteobacteria bacterium]|nr:IS4 family transposase [Gammaproteobacteria bacterium]NKC13660.1 IS4 family transposase [Gammaproteobacteria bacterium]